MRSRSWVATATSRSIPSRSGFGTRRSTRSGRARRKSSGLSSRAPSPASAAPSSWGREGMFDLTGRVAIVTGASRGLGRQDALTLAGMGADVVITDVLVEDDPNLQQTAESQGSMLAQVAVSQGWVHSNATAEQIRSMGRKSLAIKMDVTNREQVRDVFKKVK